jgi:transcriptional regulator GlxA family with amidase domain
MTAMLHPDSTVLHLQATAPAGVLSSLSNAFAHTPFKLPARGGLPPRALRRVRDYVLAHIEENITIQALASMVGLSRFHFTRAFKQSEGVTPHRYLLQCRVKRVQELLAATELPLSEIALAAGFSDQSHCSRRFRELVGITPSRYRWSLR